MKDEYRELDADGPIRVPPEFGRRGYDPETKAIYFRRPVPMVYFVHDEQVTKEQYDAAWQEEQARLRRARAEVDDLSTATPRPAARAHVEEDVNGLRVFVDGEMVLDRLLPPAGMPFLLALAIFAGAGFFGSLLWQVTLP